MGKHRNSRQDKIVVNFMEAHPDMAMGYNRGKKAEYDALWECLTKELNSVGPPVKDCGYWKKSWTDWKTNIKKRINAKKADESQNDPTYSFKLSMAEESIARVCKLYEPGEGLGSPPSLQDSNTDSNFDDESLMDIILGEEKTNTMIGIPTNSTAKVRNNSKLKRERENSPDTTKDNPDSSEVGTYKDFSKCLDQVSKVANNLAVDTMGCSEIIKSIADSLDGWCSLYAEQNKETARHNRVMEDLMREKISIKMRSLELQELQYKMLKEKQEKTRIKTEIE